MVAPPLGRDTRRTEVRYAEEKQIVRPESIIAMWRAIVQAVGIRIERKTGEPGRPLFEKVRNATRFRLRIGYRWKAIAALR